MGLEINYIDGQTPLSEEEKDGLKIPSVTTREELDEFEQLNIEKAIQWTFGKKIKAEELLSEKFVKDLHKRMNGDVWKWAGPFRISEKNLGIKSYLIPVQLKQLIDDAKFWYENNTFPSAEIAIRFKHELVSIHCFPNWKWKTFKIDGRFDNGKTIWRTISLMGGVPIWLMSPIKEKNISQH